MCECEEKKFKHRAKNLVAAGDDLVAAIEKANWGTIRHPTIHMELAIDLWKERTCHLRPKNQDESQTL